MNDDETRPDGGENSSSDGLLRKVQSGVYRYISTGFMPCKNCPEETRCEHYVIGGTCTYLSDLLDATIRDAMGLPGVDPEIDAPLVVALSRELVLQTLILWRIQKAGAVITGADGEPRGARLLKEYGASVFRMLRISNALAITPAQRRALKSGQQDLASLMAQEKDD